MADMNGAPANLPGMIRMIVVNTHRMKNRIEEVPLDRHTAIIAKNQSGKTSLLKLLPFFWGSQMREIQQPSAEKKSFIEFYLPTDASYIAAEYFNSAGEVRAVVVHTDPQKQRLQYRLIRGRLSVDMFRCEQPDGKLGFVKNIDFESNARRLGHTLNPRLISTTKEYRGIIQGRIPFGENVDKQEFSGLIHDYGIGKRAAPLENVDRLFLTMLDNNFSLSDLLSTVTNKAIDSGKSMRVSILGSSNSPESLEVTEDFRSYRRVMAQEQVYRDADSANNKRMAFESEIARLTATLRGAVNSAETELNAISANIEENRAQARVADDQIATDINASTTRLSATNGDIVSVRRDIKRIEDMHRGLLASGADKAGAALAERPALIDRLNTITKTIEALNGGREQIEARFSRIIDGIREAHRAQAELADARLIAIPEERAKILEELEGAMTAVTVELDQKHADLLAHFDATIEDAIQQGNRIADVLSDLKAEPALLTVHEHQTARLNEQKRTLSDITEKGKRSQRAADDAHTAFIEAQGEVNQVRKRIESLERREEAVRAQREPEPGSLRHWLERNKPDWRATLGKVIREDMLAKKDLTPGSDDGSSLFGVTMDLAKVENGCGSLEALEVELLGLMDDLTNARTDLQRLTQKEESAASARMKALKTRDNDRAQIEIAEANVKTATEAEADASRAVRHSIDQQRKKLQDQRSAVAAKINSLRTERSSKVSHHAAEISGKRAELAMRVAAATQHLDEESAAINLRKKSFTTERDAKIAAAEADKASVMKAEGTDAGKIDALMSEEKSLQARLTKLEALEGQKSAWDNYVTEFAPQLTVLTDRESAFEREVDLLTAQISALNTKRTQLAADARVREDVLHKEKTESESRLNRGKARIGKIGYVDQNDPAVLEAKAFTIDDLIEELDNRADDLAAVKKEIATGVRKLQATFQQVSGKVRENYIINAKSIDLNCELHLMLPIFANWYESAHLVIRSHIEDLLPMICAPIIAAWHSLVDFDAEIASVSKRLRVAIAKLAHFPGISEVDLWFRSKIRDVEYWDDLDALSKTFAERLRDPEKVPADDLIDALERLLRNWPQGASPEIDLRDMLYIEGSLLEGLEVRKINRDTDLGKLSSEGGASILRLIILTAAVHLIRDGSNVRFTWCVDEFGRLDRANSRHLLEMLTNNGIILVTGAPDLNHGIRSSFANCISINLIPEHSTTTLITVDHTGRAQSGIREWDANTMVLDYPLEVN